MFRPAPSIQDQPRVITHTWRTYVIKGEVHLVCVIPATGKVRTTTPIRHSDPDTQVFTTESGRVYQCMGPMEVNTLMFRVSLLLSGLIDDVDSFTGEADVVQ